MKTRIGSKKPQTGMQKTVRLREAFVPVSSVPVTPGDEDPATRVDRTERFGHNFGQIRLGASSPPPASLTLRPLPRAVPAGESGPPVVQRSQEGVEDSEAEIKRGSEEDDHKEPSNQEKFVEAVRTDQFELAAQLLQEDDVDIDDVGDYGTLLYQATDSADEPKVAFLLEHNANVDIQDPDFGETPLLAAVKKKNASIVHLLLEKGADPDLADEDETAPIHKAVEEGDLEILNLLLGKNPNLNVPNDSKQTPLHIAVDKKNQAIIKLLAEHGADMTVRDDDEKTPLENIPGKNTELRSSLRESYPPEVKKAFVVGFQMFLAKTPPQPIKADPTQSPDDLAKVLRGLAGERYRAFESEVREGTEQKSLVSTDIGYHERLLEESSLPWKDALKFLGHVHSLGGKKDTGLLKIDLEGFASRDSIFHNLLALQSYLEKVGSGEETAKKAEVVAKRIETLAISYQRGLDLQLAKHFFNTLGLPQETTEEIYGSVALAVSTQEVSSGGEFLLPVGFSGKDSGHAIYLGGRGNFKEGGEELTVHNLGALSENHPKGPPRGNLSSFFPFAVTGISEGQGLTAWLQSVISALVKDEAGPAEQALYRESPQIGQTPGSEDLGQGLSPQVQQVVGNCSVKNLHSFLLTSLQRELGPEEGQKLYQEVKERVKEFARTSAQKHVKEEEEPLSLSIQEILTTDLPQKRLRNAALKGDNKKLSEILSASSRIDVNETAGEKTLLEVAIEQNNPEGSALLLAHGAQVTAGIKRQIIFAVFQNKEELLAALLSAGLDASQDFHDGLTLLHIAVADSSVSLGLIALFLKSMNPNVKDPEERTPLHLAANRKRKDVALLLLERGADPKLPDKAGKLPFQIALEKDDPELAELLKPKEG